MRYQNSDSGISIDLAELDQERKRFYRAALEKYHKNAGWFEFESFAFAFNSPVFRRSRSRKEVMQDPLYLVLKDMWLQLGINQGFVEGRKERSGEPAPEKGRKTSPHLAQDSGNVETADQPGISSRRGR